MILHKMSPHNNYFLFEDRVQKTLRLYELVNEVQAIEQKGGIGVKLESI